VSPQDLFEVKIRKDTIHTGPEKGSPLNNEWVQMLNEAGDCRIQDFMSALK
jgi:hypothetical protein